MQTFSSRRRTLFAVLVPLLLAACGPSRPEVYPGANVVLILADTLRADHLASYGYGRETSPHLDRLAAENVQFQNTRSQSSCTFPSVSSLLTSRNIFQFIDPETRPAIPESVPSLAEILGRQGYRTLAVSASPIVRATPSKTNPRGGYGRGFDAFDERCLWYPATCVSEIGLELLDEASQENPKDAPLEPFFLYLHYMDPHDPYIALPRHRGRFAEPYTGEHEFIAAGDPNPIDTLIQEGTVEETLEASDIRHLVDLYDEEILSLDHGLNQFLEGLEKRGLRERTILVIASDHGEAFYENGVMKHCFTVSEPETRVPFIFAPPAHHPPARPETWVENLDIVPTLLDYLDVDPTPYELEGRSLRPVIDAALRGAAPPKEPVFSAMSTFRSVNDDRYKLVLNYADKRPRLFDLVEDPLGRRDLAGKRRKVLERLLDELSAWTESVEGDTDIDERLRRAREIEDELRAVGYLGG